MTERAGWYDPLVFNFLKESVHKTAAEYAAVKTPIPELKPGMLLDEELLTNRGALLLSAGQEITLSLILRLANFADAGLIPAAIQVRVPVSDLPATGVASGAP